MADRSVESWYPTAAYLYVLHLDSLALAWEYLRRNPGYRLDWLRYRRRQHAARQAAQRWGLRLLEDPCIDARDAQPAWEPGSAAVLLLYPDADPPPGAEPFSFWRIPGHKQLIHDGRGLAIVARSPGHCRRFALAPGLNEGMAMVYACRRGTVAPAAPTVPATLTHKHVSSLGLAAAGPRPTPVALLELHTLQALDATLAGATPREVAEGLFGADAAADWYADGGLRSKVRRLVRRGDTLMRDGYRRLAQLPSLEKGRFAATQNDPEQEGFVF